MSEPITIDVPNLICVSCTHTGCGMALAHPDGHRRDEGGMFMPSPFQLKLWVWWESFWTEWVPIVTRGEPWALCHMGDMIDGVHHSSVTQWTHNLKDQRLAAEKIMTMPRELCPADYYQLRGTEVHDSKSGQEVEEFARDFNATPDESGNYSRYELWVRLGGKSLINLMHHIGITGRTHYETSAIMGEMAEGMLEAARWNDEIADVTVRAHRHRNAEMRLMSYKGFVTSCTVPSWQLKTPHAARIAGAR